jgi:hypothetical protein
MAIYNRRQFVSLLGAAEVIIPKLEMHSMLVVE